MSPDLFDAESSLPGPVAFRRAVNTEFVFSRERCLFPGLAIIQVKSPSPMVAEAVGQSLKAHRSNFDAAGRIDERTFGAVVGGLPNGGAIQNALTLLEAAAEAAAASGSGDVKARVYWLHAGHVSAEVWYREAVRGDAQPMLADYEHRTAEDWYREAVRGDV